MQGTNEQAFAHGIHTTTKKSMGIYDHVRLNASKKIIFTLTENEEVPD
jgi:hypothetical protein